MIKRKIAIFTGNRAEYGLQYPILRSVSKDSRLEYQLIVSGAHLDENFGKTLDEIRQDGFTIAAEVRIDMGIEPRSATAQAIGAGVLAISRTLDKLKPDILVVYADRFEGFAAVIAATQMNIPTAHVEGGDLTEGGALDDSVRHAMTKLSHLHFTTNKQASMRILAMGEEPWRVHTVGLPALDLIFEKSYAQPQEIVERLVIDLERPIVLFTQHSITTEVEHASSQIRPSLEALRKLAEEGVQVILTYPNNDAGGLQIIEELEVFRKTVSSGIQLHRSLGRYFYHGLLALSRDSKVRVACVGNSSSGIKETPAFRCPSVNIGSRQQGRLRGNNVIDTGYNKEQIIDAVLRCFYDENFRQTVKMGNNPYFQGGAGLRISKVLAEVCLDQKLLRKSMTLKY